MLAMLYREQTRECSRIRVSLTESSVCLQIPKKGSVPELTWALRFEALDLAEDGRLVTPDSKVEMACRSNVDRRGVPY